MCAFSFEPFNSYFRWAICGSSYTRGTRMMIYCIAFIPGASWRSCSRGRSRWLPARGPRHS